MKKALFLLFLFAIPIFGQLRPENRIYSLMDSAIVVHVPPGKVLSSLEWASPLTDATTKFTLMGYPGDQLSNDPDTLRYNDILISYTVESSGDIVEMNVHHTKSREWFYILFDQAVTDTVTIYARMIQLD